MNKLKVAIVGTVYPTDAQARCSKPEREPSVRAHMLCPHKVEDGQLDNRLPLSPSFRLIRLKICKGGLLM